MLMAEGARSRGPDEDKIFVERLGQIARRGAKDDRFRVLSEIAQGGMGRVLRVYDEDLRRELAMKVIRLDAFQGIPSGASTDARENLALFLEEVQITGQLDHPSVVPVHDIGVNARGELYYLMPLLRGVDLKVGIERMRRTEDGWTLVRVIEAICRAAQAVEHAHRRGVVHRDLKPANLMVGDLGEIWVLDWGLAQLQRVPLAGAEAGVDSETHLLLRAGGIVGTPGYMAPEQAEGLTGATGTHSDVYALGAVLYHALTGEMPYTSPPQSCAADTIVQRTLSGPPRSVHELEPQAQPELVAICEKAMQRDPAQRYASALAMAVDLRAWLEGRVVSTYDVGIVGTFRKWRRRNRAAARSLDALAVVAVFGSLAFAIQQRRNVIAVERANVEEMRANHAANLRAADLSIQGYDAREAQRLLELCPTSMRGWEWDWLRAQADASRAVLTGHKVGVVALSADAHGRHVASLDDDGGVWSWDVAAREGRCLIPARPGRDRRPLAIALAPSGRTLAALTDDGGIEIRELDTPAAARVLRIDSGTPCALAWSGDGKRLACGTTAGGIAILDAADGAPLRAPLAGRAGEVIGVRGLAFSPDGTRVLAWNHSSPPLLWSWDSEAFQTPLKLSSGIARAASFSADGSRIVATGGAGQVLVHDPSDGTLLEAFDCGRGSVHAAEFTNDGRALLLADHQETLLLWPLDGAAPEAVLIGHTGTVEALARLGTTGDFVSCSADGTLRLWTPSQRRRGIEQIQTPGLVACGQLAEDGGLHAVTVDGRIAVRRGDAFDLLGPAMEPALGLRAAVNAHDGLALLGNMKGALELRRLSDGGMERAMTAFSCAVSAVALDAGGLCFAAGADDGTLAVYARETGIELLRHADATESISALAFSPPIDDGPPMLAYGRKGGGLWLDEPFAGGKSRTLSLRTHEIAALAWSSDGRRLAVGTHGGTITLFDPLGGQDPEELVGHGGPVRALWLSADGSRLYSASRDKTLRIWDPRYAAPLLTLPARDLELETLATDASGRRIACGDYAKSARGRSIMLIWSIE